MITGGAEAERAQRARPSQNQLGGSGERSVPRAVALKEWALVCDLLIHGHQIALIRKGGIHEPHRGAFSLEHDTFLLYPNAEHQSPNLVHPRFHDALQQDAPVPREHGEVIVPGYCRVTDVLPLADPKHAHALTSFTCWNESFFAQRLAYKPERPLLLILTRAYRFPEPLRLPYHKAYAGCRSWVPLRDAVDDQTIGAAVPALDDASYKTHRLAVLGAAR